MGSVVTLNKPAPRIWVCGCGCSTFNLYEDGTAQCALCDAVPEAGGWHAPSTDATHNEPPLVDIQGNGCVSFARARVRSLAAQEDARLLVVAVDSGTVSVWADYETEEQREWMRERIANAREMIDAQRLAK